jgi:hypothetical protein
MSSDKNRCVQRRVGSRSSTRPMSASSNLRCLAIGAMTVVNFLDFLRTLDTVPEAAAAASAACDLQQKVENLLTTLPVLGLRIF